MSLTSQIGKIFEKIIKTEIVVYLERNGLISDSQHGFRSKRSCLTNLLEFMNIITNYIDNGDAVDVIYLDFQIAFDKVSHARLIEKIKALGIDGKVLQWIKAWLTGRMQRVVLDGEQSSWQDVLSGVPQGSVLGPILFIIFINDLEAGIKSRILKFADDAKLIGKVASVEDLQTIKKDLENLWKWSEDWQMKFNVEKCKIMHIGYKNNKEKFELGGKELIEVEEEKDLGVVVRDNLKVRSQCVTLR